MAVGSFRVIGCFCIGVVLFLIRCFNLGVGCCVVLGRFFVFVFV